MNLYIRLMLYWLRSYFKPAIHLLDTSVVHFRVWPNDLDFNMHMNNGRYLTLMDLGRLDLMKRSGLSSYVLKQGYAPVLAAVQMRFRLPLHPFQRYALETQLISWDEKFAYMEQRFVIIGGAKSGAVAAIALLKAGIFDPKTKVMIGPKTLQEASGIEIDEVPPLPDYFKTWLESEETLQKVTARS